MIQTIQSGPAGEPIDREFGEHSAESLDRDGFQDYDLESRVKNYLLGYKMPALEHVVVEVSNGMVILRGRVYSFFQKQLCIHCCRRVAGVFELVDELEVVPAATAARRGSTRPR